MIHRLSFALAALLALSGCAHAANSAPLLEGRPLPITPIPGHFGTVGRLDRPINLIVRNPSEWPDFWAYANNGTPVPPLPQVDFRREMVLVSALGEISSGGTSVRIASVRETDEAILVLVRRVTMGPGCRVSEGHTFPTAMARIPRSEKFVHWMFRDETQDCKGDLVRELIYRSPYAPPAPVVVNRLIAESRRVDVREGPNLRPGGFVLHDGMNPDIYLVGLVPGERRQVCFTSGPNTHCETVGAGDAPEFLITYQGRDYGVRVVGKLCSGGGQWRPNLNDPPEPGECDYP